MTNWLKIENLLTLVAVAFAVAFLLRMIRNRRTDLEEWLERHAFSSLEAAPEEVLEALGKEKNWRCYQNEFILADGRKISYLAWFGLLEARVTTYSSGNPKKVIGYIPHFALSFDPQTVGENFEQMIEAPNSADETFNQQLESSEARPYQKTRQADGSFIIAWRILPAPAVLNAKLEEIKELLKK